MRVGVLDVVKNEVYDADTVIVFEVEDGGVLEDEMVLVMETVRVFVCVRDTDVVGVSVGMTVSVRECVCVGVRV